MKTFVGTHRMRPYNVKKQIIQWNDDHKQDIALDTKDCNSLCDVIFKNYGSKEKDIQLFA